MNFFICCIISLLFGLVAFSSPVVVFAKKTSVCCIPTENAMKNGKSCKEVIVDYAKKTQVNKRCATALGGDANYDSKYDGKCSDAPSCKKDDTKAGVALTKTKVGGGNFEIGELTDPFGSYTVPTLIGTIIKSSLSVIGTIALVLFIYAGIMWMTASGNEERTRSAAKIMMWTVLGLVVIFASYILVNFVFSAL